MRWLDGTTDSNGHEFEQALGVGDGEGEGHKFEQAPGMLQSMGSKESDTTELLN